MCTSTHMYVHGRGWGTARIHDYTFLVPERRIFWNLSALFLSRKNCDKPSPVITFRFRIPSTSRATQYREMEAHDWSVRKGQFEMSKLVNVFPAVLAICMW